MYFNPYTRIFFIASALFLNLHAVAFSQAPTPEAKPAASSISGRVTIGGNPAIRKRVLVRKIPMRYGNSSAYSEVDESREGKAHIAVTDADGNYRMTGLSAGAYTVSVDILRSYTPGNQSGQNSRQVNLDEEEERSNVDFMLVKGGVITGRVTYPDGRLIVAGYVYIRQADEAVRNFTAGGRSYQTDDRGIYRIYGLPAGRYRVSAGAPGKSGQKYAATYHPDAIDEKQAAAIEVKEGSEVGDIDIRLSVRKKEGYDVIGRVIDSETSEPVSQAMVICSGSGSAQRQLHVEPTDSQGNFRLTGLTPGQYNLRVAAGYSSTNQQKYYSDQKLIEVIQGDVSGIELIAKRGGAISGVVVFDEGRYPALKERMSQIVITGKSIPRDSDLIKSSSDSSVKVNSDGSFLLEGLPPQIVRLDARNSAGARSLLLLRIEKDGFAIPNSMEVNSGQTIAGIRLVMTDKTGTIRGQVNFTGNGLPDGQGLIAFVYRNDDDSSYPTVIVDKKGRFVIEGLGDGEYQVVLNKRAEDGSGGLFVESQRVQVARGSETQVTFTLDLDKGRRKNDQ